MELLRGAIGRIVRQTLGKILKKTVYFEEIIVKTTETINEAISSALMFSKSSWFKFSNSLSKFLVWKYFKKLDSRLIHKKNQIEFSEKISGEISDDSLKKFKISPENKFGYKILK